VQTHLPSWLTSEGRKVRRASAPLCGNAHEWSTDSQSEQNSEVEDPRSVRGCFRWSFEELGHVLPDAVPRRCCPTALQGCQCGSPQRQH
jgi:hypothetical protein